MGKTAFRKKSLFITVMILLLAAFLLLLLSVYGSVSQKPKEQGQGVSALYRKSSLPGLPHEHVPGAAGRLQGVWVRFNSRGFRGEEIKDAGSSSLRRIVVLGDSLVFGQGVAERDTLPAHLERIIKAGRPDLDLEVINAGVRGYNIPEYLVMLEQRIVPLAPDIVLLVTTEINDLEREPWKPRSERLKRWESSKWRRLPFVKPFMGPVYAGEINRLFELHVRDIYDPEGQSWRMFVKDLETIKDICHSHGIELIAVTFPMISRGNMFEKQREQLKGTLDEIGIPRIDPLPAFQEQEPDELVVSREDFHPNGKALEIVAKLAAEKIEPMLKRQPAGEED